MLLKTGTRQSDPIPSVCRMVDAVGVAGRWIGYRLLGQLLGDFRQRRHCESLERRRSPRGKSSRNRSLKSLQTRVCTTHDRALAPRNGRWVLRVQEPAKLMRVTEPPALGHKPSRSTRGPCLGSRLLAVGWERCRSRPPPSSTRRIFTPSFTEVRLLPGAFPLHQRSQEDQSTTQEIRPGMTVGLATPKAAEHRHQQVGLKEGQPRGTPNRFVLVGVALGANRRRDYLESDLTGAGAGIDALRQPLFFFRTSRMASSSGL